MSSFAVAPSWWWMPANGAAHGTAFDREMVLSLAIAGGLMILATVVLIASALKGPAKKHVNLFGVGTLLCVTVVFAWLLVRAERMWAVERFTGADGAAMQVEVVGERMRGLGRLGQSWWMRRLGTPLGWIRRTLMRRTIA